MIKNGLNSGDELENWWQYCLLGSGDGGSTQTERPIRQVPGNRKLQPDIMAGRESLQDSRKGIITCGSRDYRRQSWLIPPALEYWEKEEVL